MKINGISQQIDKYREGLVLCGKRVNYENPDRLSINELMALTEKIFEEINEIDIKLGYPYHETGVKCPKEISKERQKELWVDFLDWYQVVPTPSGQVYEYVIKNYPIRKYPKILCVGDGENCHLGRKLAMKGYNVVSVDPVAKKDEFSGKIGNSGGKLYVVKAEFFSSSVDMIDWADLIVGSKVPQCAEELIQTSKPAVFNISGNAEIYRMRFNGISINSSEQLVQEIAKSQGVSVETIEDSWGKENTIFVYEGRTKDVGEREE